VWLERQGKLSGIAVVTNGTVVVAGADLLADILGGSLPWTVVVGRTVVWAAWKVVLDSTVGFGCGSLLLLLVLAASASCNPPAREHNTMTSFLETTPPASIFHQNGS